MKVLVLSHLFPRPTSPWSGVFVAEQVAALRAQGVDARVLWGYGIGMPLQAGVVPRDWTQDQIVPSAAFAYRVPHRLWRFFAAQGYAYAAMQACKALVGNFRFDLIHAHTSWIDGYTAMAIAARYAKPVVLTEHSGPFSTQIDNPVKHRATARALFGAQSVFAVSDFLRSQMLQAFPTLPKGRIDVLGNGIDSDIFSLAGRRRENAPLTALWIGGFVDIKQPLMMLRAFAEARKTEPSLRLEVVGEGPLDAEMRKTAAELELSGSVTWHGSLPRAKVSECLASSDFLIVSSRAETFSVVTLEALTVGRPVVTTRCGGPEEIVQSDRFGLIVGNSQSELADGIRQMARSCRNFEPKELRRAALDRYAFPVIAKRLVKTYDQLLAREAA